VAQTSKAATNHCTVYSSELITANELITAKARFLVYSVHLTFTEAASNVQLKLSKFEWVESRV
jgi:hypothetical protein